MLTLSLWRLGLTSAQGIEGANAQANSPATFNAATNTAFMTPTHTTIEISSTVRLTGTKRMGMNLGAHLERGGSYLRQNVISNPGFEAGEYNMIFLAQGGATPTRVQADWGQNGLAASQPVGFWNGAAYEIISGTTTLGAGTVISFTQEDGDDTFYLDGDGPAPALSNVIIVRRQVAGYCCPIQPFRTADTDDVRPGSPGAQSLRLMARNPGEPDSCQDSDGRPSWSYQIDSFWRQDVSAGKLLIADGDWHFEIWARAPRNGDQLSIRLRRQGVPDFFNETIALTTEWQQIVRDFSVPVNGDLVGQIEPCLTPPALMLSLHVAPNNGPVWVDDVILARSGQTNPTVFSDKLVASLQELRPGTLRNWGMHQLGSTLDNQLAEPWARRATGYRPDQEVATQWHYSIHEFLELAALIDTEPWIVIPPSFSTVELQNLVAYLAAEPGAHPYADVRVNLGQSEPWITSFSAIHLEVGNEMWGGFGSPFLGAVVVGGVRLGQMADNRFSIIRSSPFFDPGKFNLIIGSQANFPTRTLQIEGHSTHHDSIALAPYFYQGDEIESWATDEEIFYPLFAWPQQDVQALGRVGAPQRHLNQLGHGTELAVYEINFHTTGGTIPLTIRNDLVTSLGGGLALPLFMLTYQYELGIRNQNVWRLTAFSNPVEGAIDEYVRVFGALRDLEATGRKRSTGLGMQLTNLAIRGDLLETHIEHGPTISIQPPINGITGTLPITVPLIRAFAYQDNNEYGMMVFNLDLTTTHTVTLQLPTPPQITATLHALTASSIHADNEEAEDVSIQTGQLTNFSQNYALSLAPHSAYVLTWQVAVSQQAAYLPIVANSIE